MKQRPFQIGVQRPDGTYQVICEDNPVPVTVHGLPTISDGIQATINNATAKHIEAAGNDTAAIIEAERQTMVELWWASWAICGQIELTRKAIVWAAVGMGILLVTLFIMGTF